MMQHFRIDPQHLAGLRRIAPALILSTLVLLLAWHYFADAALDHVSGHLMLHQILETLSIIVSFLVFSVGWKAHGMHPQRNVFILACGFLGVGILDFSHMLSTVGMPQYFTANSIEKSIAFWLPARYLAALSLLTALLLRWDATDAPARARTQRGITMGAVLLFVAVVHGVVFWYPELLPPLYEFPKGLTDFKIWAEYGVIALLACCVLILLARMRRPTPFNAPQLLAAVWIMGLGEFFFTFYVLASDYFNLLGHIYKILGFACLYLGIFTDTIEAPYRALSDSQQQLRKLKHAVEQTPHCVLITDLQARIEYVNPAFSTTLGYQPDEVLHRNAKLLSAGATPPDVYQALWGSLSAGRSWEGELLNRRRDGTEILQAVHVSPMRDEWGAITHYLSIQQDITERRRTEAHIQKLANFDSLTGLPNRTLFTSRFEQALALTQRSAGRMALMFMDLDHFKNVNESLGHHVGDDLLIEVARRLQGILRKEDTVCRQGGDEFILVFPLVDAQQAAHLIEALLVHLRRPMQIGSHELVVTASAGIVLYPDDGEDFQTLAQRADAALFRAKESGRDRYSFFSAEMQAASSRLLRLENALRNSIEHDQLSLHFQPQVRLRDGRMTGVEALLRWYHPDLGMIEPSEFIPVAESSAQILTIGHWVLRRALKQLRLWHDGGDELSIAVNLSIAQFRHPGLVDMVRAGLNETGIPPHCLELELTEGIAMDAPQRMITIVQQLSALGVRLSIDDFGTGFSSFSYIQHLRVHTLKIDQSFVQHVDDESGRGTHIVQAIVSLARGLGLRTTAEGVETAGQAAALARIGCDSAQGWLFGRPVPAAGITALLGARRSHASTDPASDPL